MNVDAIQKILDEEVSFYTDKLNETEVYVEYTLFNGATCFESIKSKRFRAFLGYRYRQLVEENEVPDFKNYLAIKKDDVIYLQNNRVSIHHRITGSLAEGITYFLADDNRRYITITPDEYKISSTSEFKFLKETMDSPQIRPKKGGDCLRLLLPKLNMPHDDALLYAVFLIQGFSRNSSHFAAIISSSKGTGKSTLTKMSTELISPTTAGVTLQPKSEDDLKAQLAGNYVVAFDNTAPFSASFSNILCSAITGIKAAKRKLYTDSDQIVLSLHNLIFINGIDVVPYKSDLMERSLYFELLPIPADKRRTDREIWAEFNEDKPYILGAIFKTLAKAMHILPTVKIEGKSRMAETHEEMMAVALALGIEQTEFQRILDANRKKLEEAYADTNPFVDFVLNFMQAHGKVDWPAEKLYQEMTDSIVGDKSFFPKTPSLLSRRLNEEKDTLFKHGYTFEKHKTETNNYLRISRVPQNQQVKSQIDAAARRAAAFGIASSEK